MIGAGVRFNGGGENAFRQRVNAKCRFYGGRERASTPFLVKAGGQQLRLTFPKYPEYQSTGLGGHPMMKLKIAVFAGALACSILPALAADLPDYGSKNFSPSDNTPAYFANESVPVAARTADTTENDWSEVDAIAPAQSSLGHSRWRHRSGNHGRYGLAHASGRHGASHFDRAVWGHTRGAAGVKHSRSGLRHASGAATHPGA